MADEKDNTGDRNTGDRNTGDRNTGDRNTGYRNTGDRNTGHRNTGHYNTGHYNTGHYNTGDRNAGHYNTGHYNTGDCNTSHRNTGYFCTETPAPTFFDRPTSLTWDQATGIYEALPLNDLPIGAEWVASSEMTDQEKAEFPTHATVGGFLRKHTLPINESFPIAWAKWSEEQRSLFTSLPNFDAEKFLKWSGVDVRKPAVETVIIQTPDGRTVEIIGRVIAK